MTEPTLDRGETWRRFYLRTARAINELEIAMEGMPWWERDQAETKLRELKFYLFTAERSMNDDSR